MDSLKKGWLSDIDYRCPDICLSLKINKVLYTDKSDYQDVMVVETKTHGNALILDGAIQCTEKDEFSYQESAAFIPLCCHPNPENVLIIGGGDGGVAREVAKHPGVKSITQVEIDSFVVEAAKKYLPGMSVGFSHPKVNLIIGDGFEFMKNHANEFDVIITDSSDPVGPAEVLIKKSYFKLMSTALRPGGIISSQAGFVWMDIAETKLVLDNCRSAFPIASFCFLAGPTYPTGQIGLVIGSLDSQKNFKEPLRTFSEKELDDMKLRYYSAEVHRAAFALPRFVAKALRSSSDN